MLEVRDLVVDYGDGTRVLDGLSLAVARDEVVCLLGPSGCGKSTLLRAVAGLRPPDGGTVLVRGRPVDGVPDGLAVVFQDYGRSLMPWSTVARNVAFGLPRDLDRPTRAARVREALGSVGLADVADRRPGQLSGGMAQRVAIARALACRPTLMLMDEPFASVDAQTRADLEDLLLRVRREYGTTVLLVTHDIDESVYLGDRVLVLSPRPAAVVDDLTVDLPSPRDQITTREDDGFVRLRTRAAERLRYPDGAPETPRA
ncbi:ABC transporter ATP-binding protein [Actinomycetospora sp. NBRC 106375]|uniref:ABC transporter ATP-binding protein n=1 Tax=Actinomycetospora sp. NBRC 106375 TaxID=3032207 RepID=UPI002552633C|nr:ABC transporter ATP-binding protein [Actinomycetospora sp. NBRC 106375]